MILYSWDGFLRETLEFPKGSQPTCSVWCGSRDDYGANAREIGLISILFGVHQAILLTWFDISVLVLWQCCWGFSGRQSSKSRFLSCLIGKRLLLCIQRRGIGPHLAEKGKSHGFSRVVAGTWGIISSNGGDVHSKLEFIQWSQDTCLGMRTALEAKLGWEENMDASGGQAGGQAFLIIWIIYIGIPINFHEESGIVSFLRIELRATLHVSKGCEPSVQKGVELWLSLGPPQGIRSSLHLVRWNMSLRLSHCRESQPSISGSIPLEAENTESLSHNYFWG